MAPRGILRTINLGETGAFSASDISCTLALTLAFLVRIVLNASLKLFCLLCFPPVVCPFAQEDLPSVLSLRCCQRSRDEGLFTNPVPLFKYGDCPSEVSKSGNLEVSIEVRRAVGLVSLGNLNVGTRVAEEARVE